MKRRSLLKAILAAPSYAFVPLAPVANRFSCGLRKAAPATAFVNMRVTEWRPVLLANGGWWFSSDPATMTMVAYEPHQETETK